MKEYLHLNYLQYFAEGSGDGGNNVAQGDNGDSNKGGNPQDNQDDKSNQNTDRSKAKYSDEDVDKMFERKFAEMMKKHEKEVDEAKKLAEMNAAEKAQYEAEKLKVKVEELERKDAMARIGAEARKMLAEEEIRVSDDLLSTLVCSDAEATKAAVESFTKLFKEAVQSAVVEKLKGKAPATGGSKGITKEQIMQVQSRSERQKLISENLELFQK